MDQWDDSAGTGPENTDQLEAPETANPTLQARYINQPEGSMTGKETLNPEQNTGWILDLQDVQRERKRKQADPDWEPYIPKNKSWKESRR